ncbi:MAG TPA: hypothetical protein VF234_10040 [Limnochordia bacterium]
MATDPGGLRRLAAEIGGLLREMETIVQDGEDGAAGIPPAQTPERATLRALGSVLHDFYTVVEDIFESIAADLDGGVPTSSDWHKRLLRSMAEPVDGVRPAVISADTATRLEEYLGFRHLFRNVYGHRLDWARMERLVRHLGDIAGRFRHDATRFRAYLCRLASDLEAPGGEARS